MLQESRLIEPVEVLIEIGANGTTASSCQTNRLKNMLLYYDIKINDSSLFLPRKCTVFKTLNFATFQQKEISDVRILKLFPGTIDALRPKKDNSKMKDS